MNLKNIYLVMILMFVALPACTSIIPLLSEDNLVNTASPTIENQETLIVQPVWLHTWIMPTVDDVKWMKDNSKIIVALPFMSEGNRVRMFDALDYKLLWDAPVHRASSTIALSFDDKYIYSGLSFPIGFQKLDTISGQLLAQGVEKFTSKDEDCYEKPAIDVVLGRDSGDLFFLVSDDADKQASYAEVQVWETNSFQCKKTLLRIEGHARSLTSDSNGNLIAVNVSEGISDYRSDEATDKGFTVIWNIESDSLICRIPDGPSIFIPGSTDLIVFQSGVDDTNKWINQLTIWDSQNCQPLVEVANILPSYNFLPALSITPDGKILAIAQRDIKLIDVSNGKLLAEIKDPSPKASDLEQTDNILFFSPDGNFLVYVTPRGVGESIVNLWHIERVN